MNNTQIEISVIVPLYNVEDYAVNCIKSLINQTFDNYEIILINDGSTDKTEEIIEPYINNENIRYYRQQNKGLSSARNFGIELAKGEYICFVDSDDYVDKDFLYKLYTASNNKDIVKCLVERVDNSKTKISKQDIRYVNITTENGYEFLQDYSACSKLFKTSFIKNNGIVFPVGEEYEETCFSLLANFLCDNYKVIEYYGYYYRQRPNSITTSDIKLKNPNIPYKGFEKTTSILMNNAKVKDRELAKFEIAKSLTSFLTNTFYLCSKEKRKELCNYSVNLINKYMPDICNNKYIKSAPLNIPKYQMIAIKLLIQSYKVNKVYLYSLTSSFCLRLLSRIGIYK